MQLLMVTSVPIQSVGSSTKIESVIDWANVGVRRLIMAIINIAKVEIPNDFLNVVLVRESCCDIWL